ncbi:MAG: mucoidy inhibitor MuiA family protein [Candidatus Thorarchaeota archaeon]
MTELETRISNVTVFRDGARITRTGKTNLAAGAQKLLISGITAWAQEDSFRVKGKGPATISSIDVRRTETVYEPKEDKKQLIVQLKKLEGNRKTITDEIEMHTSRLTYLNGMMGEFASTFGMVYAADEASISQLTKIDSTSGKMIAQTKKKLRELNDRLKDIDDQIQVLRQNLGVIESRRRTETFYEVEVSLEASKAGVIELEVAYQCSGAGWVSTYDIDLLPKVAKIRRIAVVRNRTRERWEEVALVISTATARPVEAVEPTPYMISAYDPEEERRRMKTRASRPLAMKKMAKSAPAPSAAPMEVSVPPPPPEMEEEFAEATETISGIAVYEVSKPFTIPADDEKHPVTLIEEEMDSRTLHYWFADAMSEVVAQDEVTNGDTVLLPGKVKIYSEGEYIGETHLELMSPREKFKLGTRVAHNVKAKKKLIEREVEKAGITRGKLRRSYKYRLELEIFAKQMIDIEIVDRVPHSLSTSIEVKADWEKLGVDKHELGIMEWHRKIDAGKKAEIEYAFEVQWERGISINPPLP